MSSPHKTLTVVAHSGSGGANVLRRNWFLLPAALILGVVAALAVSAPTRAAPPPPHVDDGATTLSFSMNPVPLCEGNEGDDVTITTTTTSIAHPELVDDGKVQIQIATDGLGNPVPCEDVVTWVSLNSPGTNPDGSGQTTLGLDLDNLSLLGLGLSDVSAGDIVGFRAHYITGGGQHKVPTHWSACEDLVTTTCCEPVAAGDACTKSQGYYGHWGCDLDSGLFPLVVGTGYTITFDEPCDIEGYLPAGGPPAALTADVTNPTKFEAGGVFGGQVTALKLNVLLDDCLGSLVIEDDYSAFDGMTVAEFLAAAEAALGGGALVPGSNIAETDDNDNYNNVADELNNAFDNDECAPSDWALAFLLDCGDCE